MWYHFEFTSGCNPYIATNEETAKKVIRKYRRKGYKVEKMQEGFYKIHDSQKIAVGMIVRYAPAFCGQGEEKYLHIVRENLLNPVTGKMTRWLIETINTDMYFAPTEVVDEEMIIPA